MQINKELLERALAEGVDFSSKYIGLASLKNHLHKGFHDTDLTESNEFWTYVCTYEEYLKAKAEKEKMQEFKVGDLVCVTHQVGEFLPINRYGRLKYISDQSVIIRDNGNELVFARDNCELKPHRKTQDWFGVEIDAFMTEKPKTGVKYWFFSPSHEMELANYSFNGDVTDGKLFGMGVWDSEEKAQRSVPLMRQRLIEMAGVSCKEK